MHGLASGDAGGVLILDALRRVRAPAPTWADCEHDAPLLDYLK